MHANLEVLFQTVVPAAWRPRLGVEDHREGLSKVVHLQSGRAESSQDRSVVNNLCWNLEVRSAKQEIRVCGGTVD